MTRKHSNIILIGIIVAIVLAAICVALFGDAMTRVEVLGKLFLTALRMVVVPLVLASVIVGVTQMGDIRRAQKTGLKTILYYATTTALSVGLGVILVTVIRPGAGMAIEGAVAPENALAKQGTTISDVLLSFLHPNIFGALAEGKMLPIIVFAIIFGGILTTLGEKGKPVIAFFDGFNEAIMKMVHLIMWIAPIGIFGLVASKFGAAAGTEGGLARMISGVGRYMATIFAGLAIHAFVTLPILCFVLTKRNPLKLMLAMFPALLTAWSTASSSATLPLTMECAEDRAGIGERSAGFVLPLGATINMDGTALYEAVAAIFIAQAFGVDLSFGQLLIVFLMATVVSIGAAGIPEAGLVMMVIVLQAVHLPLEGISLIVAIDWFLDRFRTATNVWGDSIGAAFIDGSSSSDIPSGELAAS
ncbi:dicarboxylate/amino acid:cation symporter [bacterium]|nr:dicarboxylate/amino acid:cation symporter [bacterium]